MYRKGFTLIELMVVILIVAILAAVAIPILRGRIQSAKWSEGAAIAGTVKVAAKVAFAENAANALTMAGTSVDEPNTLIQLGFQIDDLTGTYFDATCFTITSFNTDDSGNARIDVLPLYDTSLTGSGTLHSGEGGSGWEYTP